jgi:hypothetical protein
MVNDNCCKCSTEITVSNLAGSDTQNYKAGTNWCESCFLKSEYKKRSELKQFFISCFNKIKSLLGSLINRGIL